MTCADDADDCSVINEQLLDEVASTYLPSSTCIVNGGTGSLEINENGENENILNGKEDDLSDVSRDISEKLSAALVNVNAKEDLVKQHAKVAEEAIAGNLILLAFLFSLNLFCCLIGPCCLLRLGKSRK